MNRLLLVVPMLIAAQTAVAAETDRPAEPTHPGWTVLRTRPFLPPDFDQDVYDALWMTWPEPQRKEAQAAEHPARRRLIAEHYGLVVSPYSKDDEFDLLGYVKTPRGWVMNCLACHAGEVDGQIIPGLGNNRFALQTLVEDVRRTKLLSLKPLSHLDLAILKLPLNTTNGVSNAVIFGVVLGAKRRLDMSVDHDRRPPPLLHHDVDAPPWWRLSRKSRLYADGFAPKTHRAIMQFMLLPENDRETVLGWEDDFLQVLGWMETVKPPKYRGHIDEKATNRGRDVFNQTCSECHGTYGEGGVYPETVVPIDVVGTDPLRLRALAPEHRRWMHDGWMSRFGKDRVDLDPGGYVAPPLDGIWASAPYFHNGSVPSLRQVLAPNERPTVWRMSSKAYDHDQMGITIERLDAVPPDLSPSDRRWYFDTSLPGKSAAGHDFAVSLTDQQRSDLLEYLKTL